MITDIQVRGQANLVRTLDRAAAELPRLNTEPGAKVIVARSMATAPRRTGRLAGATRTARTAKGSSITNAVDYSVPVHYGTVYVRARPWITQAAAQAAGEAARAVEAEAQKVCDTVEGI